eukprot:6331895-Pyramimonas_sp.AAC.2
MRKVEYKIEYKTIRRRTKLRENFYLRLARHGPGTHRTSTAGLGPPPDVSPTTFIVALAPIRERLVETICYYAIVFSFAYTSDSCPLWLFGRVKGEVHNDVLPPLPRIIDAQLKIRKHAGQHAAKKLLERIEAERPKTPPPEPEPEPEPEHKKKKKGEKK